MSVRIKSTKDVRVHGIKCCVYGDAGVGKTVLSSTAPNPIIISAEHGLLSLADSDVPYIETTSLKDVDAAYKHCVKSDYDTICIDSMTEVAEVLLADLKKEATNTGKTVDPRKAYANLADAAVAMIRKFRDLPGKNVVFICRMIRKEDDSGVVTFEPNMPGRLLPYNLPYMVDELFVMKMDRKGKRFLQTAFDRKFPAKDRSGKLEAEEQPNLTAIFNKILQGE